MLMRYGNVYIIFKGTPECISPLVVIPVRDATQYVFVNSRNGIVLTNTVAAVFSEGVALHTRIRDVWRF
jgi:hypothetical protein